MISQTNSQDTLTAEDLAALLSGWASGDHGTLPQKLAHGLRCAIQAGVLADGMRLPAERAMAAALAVSRSTVTSALEELRAEGVVESRRGSGTVVLAPYAEATAGTRIAAHLFGTSGGIDLAAGNPPDASHLPPVSLDVATLNAAGGGHGMHPLGLPALRSALAEWHSRHGHLTDAAQIHVTAGSHQGIALALRALTTRGKTVAVEDITYPGIFDILDTLGVRSVPVRADRSGLLPADLDRVLSEHRPAAVYVQSGPHNPTGRAPSKSRQASIAAVLDRHGTPVIEDCALAELTFARRVRPELSDLCRKAVVVAVGSFSKVAWGGLRVGWIHAPATFVERTMYLRLGTDIGTSVPAQLIALQILPQLEELALRRRASLKELVGRAVELLGAELGEWKVREPDGGSVLWVELPVEDSAPYVLLAARHGVHITPGSIANAARSPDPHIRICVDRPWAVVEAGLHRLRVAWHELQSTPRTALG